MTCHGFPLLSSKRFVRVNLGCEEALPLDHKFMIVRVKDESLTMYMELDVRKSYLGMAMGRGRDGFYLPRPHIQFSYTYMLSYPYPMGMRNSISSPSRRVRVSQPHPHPRIE
ncbi:hypothetical protein MtrunA17_Chr4g0057541 [Medicago truncatula]|uniref:Uncharacterized protein n=1 Tax=Medicago truncatula TaxID=3880 RepID=G7JLD9_MEDTR|nr:hypothetical protein MTR_4g103500 [Medicago truncatula]RHN63368.1 hypothetical protein MtrunA17_Chr4g0057541 [Medicago truncatula]